jgi:hypothetical protein
MEKINRDNAVIYKEMMDTASPQKLEILQKVFEQAVNLPEK